MNQDYSELIEYLDKKFAETAKKDDLFKLVTLEEFDSFKGEIREDINSLRESIQSLTISVDKLVGAISDLKTEYAAITNQINRHEKWFHLVAEKLGIKLEY